MRHKDKSYGIFFAWCEIPKNKWNGYHPGIAFELDDCIGDSRCTFTSLDEAKEALYMGRIDSRIDEKGNLFVVQEVGICEIVYHEAYCAYVQGDLVSVKQIDEKNKALIA